ncbi:MAG: PCRF domain-containing protein, partial [Pseudobdellovibrionaceae bacterium]
MNYGGRFDLEFKKKRIDEINLASENPQVWGKPEEMQKLNKERAMIERELSEWKSFSQGLDDVKVLLEMASEAQDENTFSEMKLELQKVAELGTALE